MSTGCGAAGLASSHRGRYHRCARGRQPMVTAGCAASLSDYHPASCRAQSGPLRRPSLGAAPRRTRFGSHAQYTVALTIVKRSPSGDCPHLVATRPPRVEEPGRRAQRPLEGLSGGAMTGPLTASTSTAEMSAVTRWPWGWAHSVGLRGRARGVGSVALCEEGLERMGGGRFVCYSSRIVMVL